MHERARAFLDRLEATMIPRALSEKLCAEVAPLLSAVENSPDPQESAAFGASPRSAALCFDRVWSLWSEGMPEEIGFAAAGGAEALALARRCLEADPEAQPAWEQDVALYMAAFWAGILLDPEGRSVGWQEYEVADASTSSPYDCRSYIRYQGLTVMEALGRPMTIVLRDGDALSDQFPPAQPSQRATALLLCALEDLSVVDEDRLTWEQVVEFRRDDEARRKYRDLLFWPEPWMARKPLRAIEDGIARKLDGYQQAIAKHGLETRTGMLKWLWNREPMETGSSAEAAAPPAAGPLGGTEAAGGAVIGRTVARVIDYNARFAELERRHRDVAFVQQAMDAPDLP